MSEPTIYHGEAQRANDFVREPVGLVLTAPTYWSPEHAEREAWHQMLVHSFTTCWNLLKPDGVFLMILNEVGHTGAVRSLLASIDVLIPQANFFLEDVWQHGGNLGVDDFDYIYGWTKDPAPCEPRRVRHHPAPPYVKVKLSSTKFARRTMVFGTLPATLTSELILRYSDVGDLVLDPFCGSGAVPWTAEALNRHGVGIDKCHEVVEYARNSS